MELSYQIVVVYLMKRISQIGETFRVTHSDGSRVIFQLKLLGGKRRWVIIAVNLPDYVEHAVLSNCCIDYTLMLASYRL